jgi:ketosteroid isomerase-like protein
MYSASGKCCTFPDEFFDASGVEHYPGTAPMTKRGLTQRNVSRDQNLTRNLQLFKKERRRMPTMKQRLTLLAVVLLSASVLALRANAPADDTQKQIQDLEEKINGAYEANDLASYFSYYARDFSQWLPEGRTDLPTYQNDWTRFIQGGARVEAAKFSDMKIQIGPSGDTAVASYILHVRTRNAKGVVSDEDNQESDVFFKRDGVWKVVFLHYSPARTKTQQ